MLLETSGIHTMIYNHPLCLLDERVWHLAVKSISDWKNEYLPECVSCDVLHECGGFFQSAKYKASAHVRPLHRNEGPERPPETDRQDITAHSALSTVVVKTVRRHTL